MKLKATGSLKPKVPIYSKPKATGKLAPGKKKKPSALAGKISDLRNQLASTPQQQPAAAPTNPNQLPWDAQYETTVGGLNQQHDLSQSQLGQQELQSKLDYGLDAGYNDPAANPFSRAALLQRSYQQNQAKSLNAYAARGQLYSGSYQNARDFDSFNNNQQYDTLSKGYQSTLQGYANQRQQNELDLSLGTANAQAQRLQNALEQEPDPSEAPLDNPDFTDGQQRLARLQKKQAKAKSPAKKAPAKKLPPKVTGKLAPAKKGKK